MRWDDSGAATRISARSGGVAALRLGTDTVAVAAPRGGVLRAARRAAGRMPFYRAFVAIEFTLLALAAAIADALADGSPGSQVLVIALIPVGVITAAGHLAAILTSDRLR